jgi:hypothetical protein
MDALLAVRAEAIEGTAAEMDAYRREAESQRNEPLALRAGEAAEALRAYARELRSEDG